MKSISNRAAQDLRAGGPHAVRLELCGNHDYVTFAGECTCAEKNVQHRFAVAGTPYGFLHSTAGEVRLWRTASGARHGLKAYTGA